MKRSLSQETLSRSQRALVKRKVSSFALTNVVPAKSSTSQMSTVKQQAYDLECSTFNSLWSTCCLYVLRQNRSEPKKNELKFDNEDDATKSQFLEQLAWVLSTGIGGDYVTAIGLEVNLDRVDRVPVGSPKFRLARNKEFQEKELEDIRHFLAKFRDSCNSTSSESDKFKAIMTGIIALKRKKIIHYTKKITDEIEGLNSWPEVKSLVRITIADLQQGQMDDIVPNFIKLEDTLRLSVLDSETVDPIGAQSKMKVIRNLEKLLRCNNAARTLLSCAIKCPRLLDASRDLRRVSYPAALQDSKEKQISFQDFAKVLQERDADIVAEWERIRSLLAPSRLTTFDEKCSDAWQNGYPHAEMQLMAFYDLHHHGVQLSPNFIGISRFACYCCQKLLSANSNIQFKGSHQKIYWKWRAPSSVQLDQQWASRLDVLQKDHMRQIEEDPAFRIGLGNSNVVKLRVDSYAESVGSGISSQIPPQTQMSVPSVDAPATILVNGQQDQDSTHMTDVNSQPDTEEQSMEFPARINKYKDMVLLLHRLREPWKRDIISVHDFVLPRKNSEHGQPDWDLLLERINSNGSGAPGIDNELSLKYDLRKEVIILGKKVVLKNERQLIPALDYFVNAGQLNIHGIICNKLELRYSGEEKLLC